MDILFLIHKVFFFMWILKVYKSALPDLLQGTAIMKVEEWLAVLDN